MSMPSGNTGRREARSGLLLPHNGRAPAIDLSEIGLPISLDQVRRLYYGGNGTRYGSIAGAVTVAGLDPDDVFSACLLGLVTRARRSSGYVPGRGYSPTTYAVMVMRSVVRNQIAAQSAQKRRNLHLGRIRDAALEEG